MQIVCLDLEGVLIPEIWINLAERTGIDELRLTTRDIPDYSELMRKRLGILEEHGLGMADLQAVIDAMGPMDGAPAFVEWLRSNYQLIILSDTYYEFAEPLMRQLGWPTLFCNSLTIDDNGRIQDFHLRFKDHKKHTVEALQGLKFQCIAAGDSFNDTGMLQQAERGFFFRAPEAIKAQFPQLPGVDEYDDLKALIEQAATELSG